MDILKKSQKACIQLQKDTIPNIIMSTCFKKHFHKILNERRHNEEFYGVFFYLHRSRIEKKK